MQDHGSFGKQWRGTPWTVKLFAAVVAIGVIAFQVISGFDPWSLVFAVVIQAVLLYGLVRGSRAAWGVSLVFEIAAVISLLYIAGSREVLEDANLNLAINTPLRVLGFFTLLHPLTRAWVGPRGELSAERLRKLAHPEE